MLPLLQCYNKDMPTIATNRKAYRDYEVLETLEAGIELNGAEVKSIKNGNVQLKDSFARINSDGEMYLHNVHISPYKQAREEQDPIRPRKLLLHREQINTLQSDMRGKNVTIAPLKIYEVRRGLIKVEIALVRGKKQYEKREKEKQRQLKKDIDQTLKKYR